MFEVFGVPFDRSGKQLGSAFAPLMLRDAGLVTTLISFGRLANDLGEVTNLCPRARLDDFNEAIKPFAIVKQTVKDILGRQNIPLMIGGDHSLALSSISGAMESAENVSLAILWIDAHADINSPLSSTSQNLHGMPIGALLHRDKEATPAWNNLLREITPKTALRDNQIAYIGLRDVDTGEQLALKGLQGTFTSTMQDVDHWGLDKVFGAFKNWMEFNKHTHLWVSFDVDSLDPVLAPGTGTMVRGGLTYREGHFLAELLHGYVLQDGAKIKLAGIDLVEVNPLIDVQNETARIAIEWLSSLLGKKILDSTSTVEQFLEQTK